MRPLIWRIAGWLGMDGNPLRRRMDRIESAVRVALVLAFLVGGPLLAVSAGRLIDASGLRQVTSERAWRQENAVVTRSVSTGHGPYGAMTQIWAPGRWRLASGKIRTGFVPTMVGTQVGAVVSVWLDQAGRVTGRPPLTTGLVLLRVVITEICSLAAAGLGLLLVAVWVRWLLNRRRLALWAIEWAMVGPRWTTRR